MPTLLSDPPQTFYLVLIGVVLVTGALAGRNQDRRSAIRFAVAGAVLLVFFLIDALSESPREEAVRKVTAMADAASVPDPDRFVEHVSQSFDYNGKNREDLRQSTAWGEVRARHARIAVWGFGRDAFERISDTEVEIGFYAKAQTPEGQFLARYVKSRFVKDPDGQYRVKTMRFYNPADRGINTEEPIPGFP
jgi:hypothetical protein